MGRRSKRAIGPRLVLASGSPRRKELLREAGYEFEVLWPNFDEVMAGWLTIRETTTFNAMRKAMEIAGKVENAVVLGADTLVTLGGQAIGKPVDLADAKGILRRLSGQAHEVWTSVYVCHGASGRAHSFQEISRVHFRELTAAEIESYVSKVDPLDKAGAYAAQGHGTEIIERIEGSYTNVVGLPMEETVRVLRELESRRGSGDFFGH